VLLDEVDRVLDGDDLLGGVVGNLDAELLLERHDQLDGIEAVGPEVVNEARTLGHLCFVHPQVVDNDFLDAIGDVTHGPASSKSERECANWLSAAGLQQFCRSPPADRALGSTLYSPGLPPAWVFTWLPLQHGHPAIYVQRLAGNVAG